MSTLSAIVPLAAKFLALAAAFNALAALARSLAGAAKATPTLSTGTDGSTVIGHSSDVQSPMQNRNESRAILRVPPSTSPPMNPLEQVDEVATEESSANNSIGAPWCETATRTTETSAVNNPSAVQIVSIGNAQNECAFYYHHDKLESILQGIPQNSPVAIVSVVGAFRTGKSFLLSWFLRYLHHLEQLGDNKTNTDNEEERVELNPDTTPWYQQFKALECNDGFNWKGGSARNTTGIWMWSKPYFIRRGGAKPALAVLLIDTQGMFDNETSMGLTSKIFGLSTLLSSYQIYNVDKRIQEDNLQHLALFAEFARIVGEPNPGSTDSEGGNEAFEDDLTSTNYGKMSDEINKPFQHIEFLVRDWQNFEENMSYEEMESSMTSYLNHVISQREAKVLQGTRVQIWKCFERITCFGLCHPGAAVTKLNFTGDVSKIDGLFLGLLDHYCQKVFDLVTLVPKVIHGHELRAKELGGYIQAYVKLFESGSCLPEAQTMLEAITSVHNTTARNAAVKAYKGLMDQVAGQKCSKYVLPSKLESEHKIAEQVGLQKFKSIAKFGNNLSIQRAMQETIREMNKEYEVYVCLNQQRMPFSAKNIHGQIMEMMFGLSITVLDAVAKAVLGTVAPIAVSFAVSYFFNFK